MTRKPYIIAIDPDVEKSGVCILTRESREIELYSFTFPQLLDYLQAIKGVTHNQLTVVVEASWTITHNWHLKGRDNACTAAAKGNGAGRNHETGRKIVEMCKHYGIEVVEHHPLKKCWRGQDGKITHQEITQIIPGLPSKSNQETRDSALLAWSYAGFPIRVSSEMYREGVMNRKTVRR